MSSKILFHIGLEKTGSTSFQDYCRANRAELLKDAVLYPNNRLCFGANNHAPLAASYFPRDVARDLLIQPWRAEREAAVAALREEIEAVAPELTLISSEHLSSRFSPERVRRLADDFAWADSRIVVVVRDAVARALSAYSTTIASGRDLTLDEFIDELCRPENPYLRYEETISRWEAAFGRDRVQPIAYVEGGDIVEILVEALIPPRRRSRDAAAYRGNASPGAAATEASRRINAARPPGRRGEIVDKARDAITKVVARSSRGGWRLSADQLSRLEAIAAPNRQWLERSYGARLAPHHGG